MLRKIVSLPTKTVAIGSAKGGVGKTMITANLAALLAKHGKKVLVLDFDNGAANIHAYLKDDNLPPFTLAEFLRYNLTPENADNLIHHSSLGFDLIVGVRSDTINYTQTTENHIRRMIELFKMVKGKYDYILIDLGPGTLKKSFSFLLAADASIIVTTDQDMSICDNYSLIRKISQYPEFTINKIILLANRIANPKDGEMIIKSIIARFKQEAHKTLHDDHLVIIQDMEIQKLTDRGKVFIEQKNQATETMEKLMQRIERVHGQGMMEFLRQLFKIRK